MNPFDYEWSPWAFRRDGTRVIDEGVMKWPLEWSTEAASEVEEALRDFGSGRYEHPRKAVVYTPADFLDPEVPADRLAQFLRLIHDTPNLNWLLLTKRPELFGERLNAVVHSLPEEWDGDDCPEWVYWLQDWFLDEKPPANVWIGTEIRTQAEADERIPALLRIPAAGRFLIVRPNGLVDLQMMRSGGELGEGEPWLDCLRGRVFDSHGDGTNTESIGWVVISGDDGPNAQPTNVEHVRSLVRQCQTAGVACWVEQLGSKLIVEKWPRAERDFCNFGRVVDLKPAHPKGGDPAEWPADLRVQKLPEGLR